MKKRLPNSILCYIFNYIHHLDQCYTKWGMCTPLGIREDVLGKIPRMPAEAWLQVIAQTFGDIQIRTHYLASNCAR